MKYLCIIVAVTVGCHVSPIVAQSRTNKNNNSNNNKLVHSVVRTLQGDEGDSDVLTCLGEALQEDPATVIDIELFSDCASGLLSGDDLDLQAVLDCIAAGVGCDGTGEDEEEEEEDEEEDEEGDPLSDFLDSTLGSLGDIFGGFGLRN